MVNVIINCPCVTNGCNGYGLIFAVNASLDAWRREAHNFTKIECGFCGCIQDLADGGDHIAQVDKSTPRIYGISPIQGTAGITVSIIGHRLDFGNLVVKFGSAQATILDRTANQVHATVPANSAGPCDVSVENENGKHVFVNGFTYTA